MFELYDRATANLLDTFSTLDEALVDIREEWVYNPTADLTLGRVENDHTVEVWAGDRLHALVRPGLRVITTAETGGSAHWKPKLIRVAAVASLAAAFVVGPRVSPPRLTPGSSEAETIRQADSNR